MRAIWLLSGMEKYYYFNDYCTDIQFRGGGGFRKAYDELGRIRNYFGDTVPWFVTSATMPTGTQKEVMQSIGIISYKSVITELCRV